MGSRRVEHVEQGRIPAKTNELLRCVFITGSTERGQRRTGSWQPTKSQSLPGTLDFQSSPAVKPQGLLPTQRLASPAILLILAALL